MYQDNALAYLRFFCDKIDMYSPLDAPTGERFPELSSPAAGRRLRPLVGPATSGKAPACGNEYVHY
jgi:hypothetical protein